MGEIYHLQLCKGEMMDVGRESLGLDVFRYLVVGFGGEGIFNIIHQYCSNMTVYFSQFCYFLNTYVRFHLALTLRYVYITYNYYILFFFYNFIT